MIDEDEEEFAADLLQTEYTKAATRVHTGESSKCGPKLKWDVQVYGTDVELSDNMKTPIFATSIAPVSYGRAIGKDEKREQEMMDNRWRCFHFKHVIQAEDVREIPPCKKYFAVLVLTCEDF